MPTKKNIPWQCILGNLKGCLIQHSGKASFTRHCPRPAKLPLLYSTEFILEAEKTQCRVSYSFLRKQIRSWQIVTFLWLLNSAWQDIRNKYMPMSWCKQKGSQALVTAKIVWIKNNASHRQFIFVSLHALAFLCNINLHPSSRSWKTIGSKVLNWAFVLICTLLADVQPSVEWFNKSFWKYALAQGKLQQPEGSIYCSIFAMVKVTFETLSGR